MVAELAILFANAGKIDLTIRRLSDGMMLFQHSGGADTWDDGSGGHDPKWGIYRSLNQRGALRDEQVRFAGFCISQESAADCQSDGAPTPPPSDASAIPEGGAGEDASPSPPDAATPPGPVPVDASVPPLGPRHRRAPRARARARQAGSPDFLGLRHLRPRNPPRLDLAHPLPRPPPTPNAEALTTWGINSQSTGEGWPQPSGGSGR